MTIGIINYGTGNLSSVFGSIKQINFNPLLINHHSEIKKADAIILPGVGNFGSCAKTLKESGWLDSLKEQVLDKKKPILGICLGMQLLADSSEEGVENGQMPAGLGLIPGKVRHLNSLKCQERLPHVGWNGLRIRDIANPLFQGIPDMTDFYFSHNYAFDSESSHDVIAEVTYGISFAAVVQRENVFGTQFHPEKSSRSGFRFLKNLFNSI